MKKIRLLLLLIAPLSTYAQEGAYQLTITGTKLIPPAKVWLMLSKSKADTAKFNKGAYAISGKDSLNKVVSLKIDRDGSGKQVNTFPIFLAGGAIVIKLDTGELTITGNTLSRQFQEELVTPMSLEAKNRNWLAFEYDAAIDHNSPDLANFKKRYDQETAVYYAIPENFIKHAPGSPLAIPALTIMGNALTGMQGKDNPGFATMVDDLNKLFHSLSPAIQNSPEGLKYAQRLAKLKAAESN
ncbi:DUF4369 domain-containing protein [Mucilaginibacter sp. dw_454]|uniref:DUF4369 domain-containing protein n=1 Tax=Mucilaginibacter sp. dw_454 TaxID=2720079 RepID=UPI001BD4E41F|nr:DUF4369 domain-containing protein [Mucilaginibacter sp. dw_454]